jgi:hypothetical protein
MGVNIKEREYDGEVGTKTRTQKIEMAEEQQA